MSSVNSSMMAARRDMSVVGGKLGRTADGSLGRWFSRSSTPRLCTVCSEVSVSASAYGASTVVGVVVVVVVVTGLA